MGGHSWGSRVSLYLPQNGLSAWLVEVLVECPAGTQLKAADETALLRPSSHTPTPCCCTLSAVDSTRHRSCCRLHSTPPDPAQPDSFVEVIDSQANLGPIVDFAVVDLERQGQGQVGRSPVVVCGVWLVCCPWWCVGFGLCCR